MEDEIIFVDTAVRVLLVEDNPGDVLLMTRTCRQSFANLEIVVCRSVREAIAALRENRFDVVFLDLNLADGMGASTVHDIRAATPDIPVVVLTGLATELTKKACRDAGASGFLLKTDLSGDRIERILTALGFRPEAAGS